MSRKFTEIRSGQEIPGTSDYKMSPSWSEGTTCPCPHPDYLLLYLKWEPVTPGSCEALGSVPTLHQCLMTVTG